MSCEQTKNRPDTKTMKYWLFYLNPMGPLVHPWSSVKVSDSGSGGPHGKSGLKVSATWITECYIYCPKKAKSTAGLIKRWWNLIKHYAQEKKWIDDTWPFSRIFSRKWLALGVYPCNSREWWMVQYRGMARSCFGINKTFKTVSFQHHLFTNAMPW